MARLAGKNVVISGAAGGQGRVACRTFAEEGARIFATDLDPSAGPDIERLLADRITYAAADLSTPDGIAKVIEGAIKLFNRIDVLYNNHGIILGKPFLDTTPEEWDKIHNVDLKSVYFLTQRAVAAMPAGASIINISSIGGLVALENMSAYGAAKGGLAMLTRCMALDLSSKGIRVNAICPGVVDTQMPRNFVANLPNKEEVISALHQRHMMKRFGRPDEVVSLALYLASDESSFMTGSVIALDGGWTAF
jgi:NAD(P)-dependent dehydrogenase (short-subunit alcohol dehydrogenase family)